MKKKPIRREDVPPDACLCDFCVGKCCRYFSLPIISPTRRAHYNEIKKYLDYGKTLVYVEKGTWYLVVMTICKYLTKENRCGVYWTRPKVCREYTTADCEYDSDWSFDKVFENSAQLDEYVEAILPPSRMSMAEAESVPVDLDEGSLGERSFTIRIDTPTTWDDYDAIRWYLAHGETRVFVRKWGWFLQVRPRRGTLEQDDFRMGDSRGKLFESAEQLWEYAEAVLPPRRRTQESNSSLPIITVG